MALGVKRGYENPPPKALLTHFFQPSLNSSTPREGHHLHVPPQDQIDAILLRKSIDIPRQQQTSDVFCRQKMAGA